MILEEILHGHGKGATGSLRPRRPCRPSSIHLVDLEDRLPITAVNAVAQLCAPLALPDLGEESVAWPPEVGHLVCVEYVAVLRVGQRLAQRVWRGSGVYQTPEHLVRLQSTLGQRDEIQMNPPVEHGHWTLGFRQQGIIQPVDGIRSVAVATEALEPA